MISFELAQQIVLEKIEVLEPLSIPVVDSNGMVLAEDIMAQDDIPSADTAKINGFAIRSVDVVNSSQRTPASLVIDGDLRAGEFWKDIVKSGHAVMVEAGAPLPEGADTIISSDFAVRENSKKVRIYKKEKPGEHISIRGAKIEQGELVFKKGKILCPSDVGLLASMGNVKVPCYRKPRISFFACGNDLVSPDQPVDMGKTRSANIYAIEAHLREFGAIPDNMGIIGLDSDQIIEQVEKASGSDMLIVSTGSSPKVFDRVKMILQKMGMDLKFWRVAIRPGKPLIYGIYKDIPVFGISENQISTNVVMEEFVRPAIMKMRGRREVRRTEVVARLDREIKGGGGKTHFIGAEIKLTDDGFLAVPENNKPSSNHRSFISVNGIIIIPPETNHIDAGETVRIQVIGDPTDLN
jgi:molybdopterin molybdotransferase